MPPLANVWKNVNLQHFSIERNVHVYRMHRINTIIVYFTNALYYKCIATGHYIKEIREKKKNLKTEFKIVWERQKKNLIVS